jgi:hypothetical protein
MSTERPSTAPSIDVPASHLDPLVNGRTRMLLRPSSVGTLKRGANSRSLIAHEPVLLSRRPQSSYSSSRGSFRTNPTAGDAGVLARPASSCGLLARSAESRVGRKQQGDLLAASAPTLPPREVFDSANDDAGAAEPPRAAEPATIRELASQPFASWQANQPFAAERLRAAERAGAAECARSAAPVHGSAALAPAERWGERPSTAPADGGMSSSAHHGGVRCGREMDARCGREMDRREVGHVALPGAQPLSARGADADVLAALAETEAAAAAYAACAASSLTVGSSAAERAADGDNGGCGGRDARDGHFGGGAGAGVCVGASPPEGAAGVPCASGGAPPAACDKPQPRSEPPRSEPLIDEIALGRTSI